MLEKLTWAAFTENLNTRFRMIPQDVAALEVELIEVKPGRSTPRQEQFSLLFRAPLEAPVQQGIFLMDHDAIGEFDLFLVPVRRDAQGLYYEGVFNRLLD